MIGYTDPLAYLLAFCRLVIGLVFATSLTGKLLDIVAFRQAVATFNILPRQVNQSAVYLFLGSELLVVASIIRGGIFLRPGFLLAMLLLFVFSVALVSVLIRNIRASCNCFGKSKETVSWSDVCRNVIFGLSAFVGWVVASDSGRVVGSLSLLEWGFITAAAIAFVVLWLQVRYMLELFR